MKLLRTTLTGGAIGLIIAAAVVGLLPGSNDAGYDEVPPISFLGLPIVVIGILVGLFSGVAGESRLKTGAFRLVIGLAIVAVCFFVLVATFGI